TRACVSPRRVALAQKLRPSEAQSIAEMLTHSFRRIFRSAPPSVGTRRISVSSDTRSSLQSATVLPSGESVQLEFCQPASLAAKKSFVSPVAKSKRTNVSAPLVNLLKRQ